MIQWKCAIAQGVLRANNDADSISQTRKPLLDSDRISVSKYWVREAILISLKVLSHLMLALKPVLRLPGGQQE